MEKPIVVLVASAEVEARVTQALVEVDLEVISVSGDLEVTQLAYSGQHFHAVLQDANLNLSRLASALLWSLECPVIETQLPGHDVRQVARGVRNLAYVVFNSEEPEGDQLVERRPTA